MGTKTKNVAGAFGAYGNSEEKAGFSKKLTTFDVYYRSLGMKATAPAMIDLTELVSKYYATLWRYLRLLGCDASLAEDLCQDTFLYVLEKPLEHRNDKSTMAYLRLAARNLFIDEIRRRRKISPADFDPALLEAGELDKADQAWEELNGDDVGQSWVEALRACVQSLVGKQRKAIEMQYMNKHSIAAIADSLKMKPSGVKTLLGRVRQRLRHCVERKVAVQ